LRVDGGVGDLANFQNWPSLAATRIDQKRAKITKAFPKTNLRKASVVESFGKSPYLPAKNSFTLSLWIIISL
jgi:hypothetical protein